MNYNHERDHDGNLIQLIELLNEHEQLNLLSQAFDLPACGALKRAVNRRPFDVELTFTNYSVVIESKVDSDENGRWRNKSNNPPIWQTTQIVEDAGNLHYLHQERYFRFITYGTSEFYTKLSHEGAANHHHIGPFDYRFSHIKLNQMIKFVESTNNFLPPCNARNEWLSLMQIEQNKRNAAPDLLAEFGHFRKHYLAIHQIENDFPRNRSLFCAPELAFPVMSQLEQAWNCDLDCTKEFGKLALFPVPRGSPSIHDSILNFWNLKLYLDEERCCYIEINEDFNLNLKSQWDINDKVGMIQNALNDQRNWPEFATGIVRDYQQGAHVVYEIDFEFLVNANNVRRVLSNLFLTVCSLSDAFRDVGLVVRVE